MSTQSQYDQVISLGRACQPAYQIRRITGAMGAHVFDWIITTEEGLVRWIASDLEDFFVRDRLEMGPENCIIDGPTSTQFVHEFPAGSAFDVEYKASAERYTNLVARWRALMKSEQNVLFVRQHSSDDDARADAVRLRNTLAAQAPRLRFKLLSLTPSVQPEWGEAGIVNRQLIQPRPYVWTGDDTAWARVLGDALGQQQPMQQRDAGFAPRLHLFVCGMHRSGTSPLHDALKMHPMITGFADTGKPKDEGQHLQSVLARDEEFGGPGAFCFDSAARLTEADLSAYAARVTTLKAEWASHWAPDRPIRIEKSPPNLIRTRFLQGAFENARFVFIVRHPLAVARATAKWTHASVEQMFRHWLTGHRIMLEDARLLKQSCCVRYEDLAADLNGALDRVWALTQAPRLTIDQELFADHNPAYLVAGREFALDWEEQRLLAHFGYNLTPPFTDFSAKFGW